MNVNLQPCRVCQQQHSHVLTVCISYHFLIFAEDPRCFFSLWAVTLLSRCCHAVATLPRCCHAASWRCASLFRSASRKLSMRRLDRGDRDRTVKLFLCETNLVRWKKVKKTQTPAEQAWWYLMMFDVTHCMLYTVYINTSILYNLYNLYNMYI